MFCRNHTHDRPDDSRSGFYSYEYDTGADADGDGNTPAALPLTGRSASARRMSDSVSILVDDFDADETDSGDDYDDYYDGDDNVRHGSSTVSGPLHQTGNPSSRHVLQPAIAAAVAVSATEAAALAAEAPVGGNREQKYR